MDKTKKFIKSPVAPNKFSGETVTNTMLALIAKKEIRCSSKKRID